MGPWPWIGVRDHPEGVVVREIFQEKYQENHVFLQCSLQWTVYDLKHKILLQLSLKAHLSNCGSGKKIAKLLSWTQDASETVNHPQITHGAVPHFHLFAWHFTSKGRGKLVFPHLLENMKCVSQLSPSALHLYKRQD